MTVANRPALMATARSLSIDRVAAEAATALAGRGVDCMLVKGAVAANALYADGGVRPYGDCDLLVREADIEAAGAALRSSGFDLPADENAALIPEFQHSHTWTRTSDRATVELHWTFIGADAPPNRLWRALRARATTMRVGGHDLAVADTATTALLAAMQLLQHGPDEGAKFRADVERAIRLLDAEQWHAAADLAGTIGAAGAFGAGLRLAPGGRELAGRLGVPDDAAARAFSGGPPAAEAARALELVMRRDGIAAKLRLLLWLLAPPPAYLEMIHPAARRGRMHLVAAYALRPLDLLWRAPATLAAWRRARSGAGG